MPREKLIVTNNAPVFGWAFMLVWMAMLLAFTWLAARDGGVPGHGREFSALIFSVFWLFGVAGCNFFLSIPRVRLVEAPVGLDVEERWLWKRRRVTLTSNDSPRVAIVDDRDSEGDPYFRCEIAFADGRRVTVKESHVRNVVEDAQATIFKALAPRCGA